MSPFSIFIHQITKSTAVLYIFSISEERPTTLLLMFLIDIDQLMLPTCPQDVIFEHIL